MQEHLNHEDRFAQLCRNIDRQLRDDPGCANRGADRTIARPKIKPIDAKKKRTARKPARAARAGQARGAEQTDAGGGGDDDGGGDPEPAGDSIDDDEHTYTRRGLSYSDQHALATYDPADPAPQIARTFWPVIPDPRSYLNIRESSWRRLSQFAGGRAREVCRLLGEGEANFKIIGRALHCSDRTARDDARSIFENVVAERVVQQIELFSEPDEQYVPRRSTRGRKKKARTPVPGQDARDEGGAA